MKKQNDLPRQDWKQNLVLLAKNTCVWLNQLSEKYQTPIINLDQIPESELSNIASRGINVLWLVGLWERSPASQKIKHLYGRKHSIASAYSIYKYQISSGLGGEKALTKLRKKANALGILLACDMVPNHTGLDAPWVFDHPDRYITSEQNPRDDFSYGTTNLSDNPAADIFLEEGYYSQTGAAEVFRYMDRTNGESRYIYHGNDGTSMPWNDTAQLNYLNAETRQAMLKEILSVARKFKIIRLDAAMTLIKEHFKRLWFPAKDAREFIPTRGENVMTDQDFDRLMPEEFWKEVIKCINKEAPDTVLIAEAFWLMEKYFINEIGMHRVYNSAFMHQLRDEKNKEFRNYLREILHTNPLMLEKFVNFLTTPDERTTLDQFGRAGKYFGACKLLACMPGLPMFGHGQWEGLQERYGMDISRPMMAEKTDQNLVHEHHRSITPLLKKREWFGSAENFRLIDFFQKDNLLDENVIAFSNCCRNHKTLVIFNNSNFPVRGSIHSQANTISKESGKILPFDKDKKYLSHNHQANSIILREIVTGKSKQINVKTSGKTSIHFHLSPYESHVYDLETS